MNIKGLDIVKISQLMAIHVESHIKGFVLQEGESLFQESYLFDFEEIAETIPSQYHYLFKITDRFNGASGDIEFDSQKYILSLLVDEDYATVFLLCLQEVSEGEDGNIIIIKNFLQS